MKPLTVKVPTRILQHIKTLRLASKLTGLDLLGARGKNTLNVGCGSGKGLLALKLLSYEEQDSGQTYCR